MIGELFWPVFLMIKSCKFIWSISSSPPMMISNVSRLISMNIYDLPIIPILICFFFELLNSSSRPQVPRGRWRRRQLVAVAAGAGLVAKLHGTHLAARAGGPLRTSRRMEMGAGHVVNSTWFSRVFFLCFPMCVCVYRCGRNKLELAVTDHWVDH